METMEGDSIPLIEIPDWDFHWQMYYTFLYPQHIPMGSKIKAVASYDNTVNNEENPNDPPIDVWGGNQTTDEMMMVYVIWTDYEQGDEDMLLDSTYVPTGISEHIKINNLEIYPNPATDHVYVSPSGWNASGAKVEFYNMMGELVCTSEFDGGVQRFDISDFVPGVYVIRLFKGENLWSSCLLIN
jgi:hypothetical protein